MVGLSTGGASCAAEAFSGPAATMKADGTRSHHDAMGRVGLVAGLRVGCTGCTPTRAGTSGRRARCVVSLPAAISGVMGIRSPMASEGAGAKASVGTAAMCCARPGCSPDEETEAPRRYLSGRSFGGTVFVPGTETERRRGGHVARGE